MDWASHRSPGGSDRGGTGRWTLGLGRAVASSSGRRSRSTTAARADHRALVAAFEKATGITVKVRTDDEDTLADEIVAEGAHSPADVISPRTRLRSSTSSKGLLARSTGRRSPTRQPVRLAAGRLGRGLGAGERAHLQPEPDPEEPAAHPVLQLADPRYKGKLAFAPGETDFQPIVTSVVADLRQARRSLAEGDQGERRRPHLSRTTRPSPTR